jgi:hypothetical protein
MGELGKGWFLFSDDNLRVGSVFPFGLRPYHAHQPLVFTSGTIFHLSQNNDAVADIAGCLCRAFGKHVASAAAFLQGLQRDLGTLTDLLLVCGNEKVN